MALFFGQFTNGWLAGSEIGEHLQFTFCWRPRQLPVGFGVVIEVAGIAFGADFWDNWRLYEAGLMELLLLLYCCLCIMFLGVNAYR